MENNTKRHRVQVDLNDEALRLLESIAEMTDAATHSEVLRNSLRAYGSMLQAVQDGRHVEFVKEGELPIQFLVPKGLSLA